MKKTILLASGFLAAVFIPFSSISAADDPVASFTWTLDNVPQGEAAPTLDPFRDGHAPAFTRKAQTRLNLGQGDGDCLRLEGALTLMAVVRMDDVPPAKVSLVSKWRLTKGGRSYELGLTPTRQLFFTISASGTWPDRAKELMSNRPLKVGTAYAVAAVYDPGRRMALYINGVASGETVEKIPTKIFDSDTPVLLGNRPGNEKSCAFEGLIGGAWFYAAPLNTKAIEAWAESRGLIQPPEAPFPVLKPPYDLDAVKVRVREWYENLQAPGRPYGAYRLTPDSPPDLYASADIAWIRWIMNDLDLTDRQREEWITFIQDQQDPEDGSYRHITGHCKTHAFCHATGALNMLGGKQRYKPRLLEPYLDIKRMPAWLDGINWVNQWGASHDIWGAGVPLSCTPETPDAWREALFAWLDAEVDPETGFWRKGVKARTPMEYLGGAFHIWPIYAACRHPIRFPERVISSVLKLQHENGSFGGGFDYGNMDGVWVLDYLGSQLDHRRNDVRTALKRNLHGLMKLYNESPGRFFSSAHSTESRIATLAMLQASLPELFHNNRDRPYYWRNPWHRPELFVLRY